MQARAPVASHFPLNQMSKLQHQRYKAFSLHELLTCKTCRHAFLAKDSWDKAPCNKSLVSSGVGLECMALPRSIKHDTAVCASWGLFRMTCNKLLMVVLRGYVSSSTDDPYFSIYNSLKAYNGRLTLSAMLFHKVESKGQLFQRFISIRSITSICFNKPCY